METLITVTMERLPEGVFLATSEAVQGLVAQGRTLQETLEIARDVARVLMEEQGISVPDLPSDRFDLPIVVAA